jgi:hypothetical protein
MGAPTRSMPPKAPMPTPRGSPSDARVDRSASPTLTLFTGRQPALLPEEARRPEIVASAGQDIPLIVSHRFDPSTSAVRPCPGTATRGRERLACHRSETMVLRDAILSIRCPTTISTGATAASSAAPGRVWGFHCEHRADGHKICIIPFQPRYLTAILVAGDCVSKSQNLWLGWARSPPTSWARQTIRMT